MEHRLLGRSGCAVSTLALGTMTFGSETDEDGSRAQLDAFVESGGNLIDTADVYSGGASEEIVGRWLASTAPEVRDTVVIATKGRFPTGPDANDVGLSRRHLQRAVDASLRRLGVDCIDLYQVHAWDPLTPLDETLRALDDMVRAGKIRYVGLSNFTGWQVQKAVGNARQHGLEAPVTLQPQYNLLVREVEWEIVPACLDTGLGLLPWSPLGGGWLTGKYRRDTAPVGATPARRGPRPRGRGLLPAIHPGADVGRGRRGAGRGREAWGVNGAGGPVLAGRPASGHVGDLGCSVTRAAERQPCRGRHASRCRRHRCSRCRERSCSRRLPLRRTWQRAAQSVDLGRTMKPARTRLGCGRPQPWEDCCHSRWHIDAQTPAGCDGEQEGRWARAT